MKKSKPAPDYISYTHILGKGDQVVIDPKDHNKLKTISACDVGFITDSGLMGNVCSFDGNANSDGGIYYLPGGGAYRSFRREENLPGQNVTFIDTVIPFGYPTLHPITGDTYVTAYFALDEENRGGLIHQKGVYVYRRETGEMELIADTTSGSESLGIKRWTDFSINLVATAAGTFFNGEYNGGQGIYCYDGSKLIEIIGTPSEHEVPSHPGVTFSNYRGVTANADTVFFVGEWEGGKGIYAYELNAGEMTTIIESETEFKINEEGATGIFKDFAIEPKLGIYDKSIAVNNNGDMVVIAGFSTEGSESELQGVFMLKKNKNFQPELILQSETNDPNLLPGTISSFNTVAINKRAEITITVAGDSDGTVPVQALVFFRNWREGLRSIFKPGDRFIAEMKHPSCNYVTSNHTGMVCGSQALDSAPFPRVIFRAAYKIDREIKNGDSSFVDEDYVLLAMATIHPFPANKQ